MDGTVERPSEPASLRWWASLVGICVLGLALRLVAIDRHSFWYDESVTARLCKASWNELATGAVHDNGNPPLYWMIIGAWTELFGRSEFAARSFSVICNLLGIVLLVFLGRRLISSGVGLAAGLLLAISPMAIELANEARVYALFGLLVTLNLLLFLRWLDKRRITDAILYVVTLALCLYSHYYAIGLPVVHGLALLTHPRGRAAIVPWLAAVGTAGILFLPWVHVLAEQVGEPGNTSRMDGRWLTQFAATPTVFCVGRTLAWRDSGKVMLGFALAVTLAGFVAPACWGLVQLRKQRWPGVLLAGWWLGPILGPLAVALVLTPLYATRYAFLALPAFLLLVAYGLACSSRRWRTAAVSILAFGTLVSLVRYVALPLKDDWRGATATLETAAAQGATVVFDRDIEVSPFLYYAERRQFRPGRLIGLVEPDRDSPNLEGVIYLAGKKLTPTAVDCTAQVTRADDLWLALCVPKRGLEYYEQFFSEHGYTKVTQSSYHRIKLVRFRRERPEPPEAVVERSIPGRWSSDR